jgi:hypothetical protein
MVEPAGQEVRVQRRPALGEEHIPGVLPRFARRALVPVQPGPTIRARIAASRPGRTRCR